MIVLDCVTGLVSVTVDGEVITLGRPTLAQWCAWQGDIEALTRVEDVAALNWSMIVALAPGPIRVDPDHTVCVAMTDPSLAAQLLMFWRDYPVSPWVAVGGGDVITSGLPGALAARAVLYKALAPRSVAEVDSMELWQIAVLLGLDTGDTVAGGDVVLDGRVEVGASAGQWAVGDGSTVTDVGGRTSIGWTRKPGAPFLFVDTP